jgi:hypothetical protein
MSKAKFSCLGALAVAALLAAGHPTALAQVNPHERLRPDQGPVPGDLAKDPNVPDPEDGAIADANYSTKYFDLSYPLAPGWEGGMTGPSPSNQGLYVLAELKRDSEPKGTLLVVAQDMFFNLQPIQSAKAYATVFRNGQAKVPAMKIDREPTEVKIGDHSFMRVDYSGVGLYRAWLATDIRCHLVSFNFTATSPEALEQAVQTLSKVSMAKEAAIDTDGASDGSASVPVCVKDYAKGDNVVSMVDPIPAGPRYTKIPVRIIVGTDGSVKHVHVVSAFPLARRTVYEALIRWKLKPYEVNGHPAEVETGLVFEFKSET